MNCALGSLQQVVLCYALVIILPAKLEVIYAFENLQN